MIFDDKRGDGKEQAGASRADSERPPRAPLPAAPGAGQDTAASMLLERATKSPDENGRLEAVSALAGDRSALKAVVLESAYRDSRMAAAELLLGDNASVVELLVSENKNASSAMLERLMREPERLKEVAKSSMSPVARELALGKIRDEATLVDIAKYSIYADSRSGALKALEGSPQAAEEVAVSSSYSDTRLAAAETLRNDREALGRVEQKCLYEDTRAAVRGLLSA